MRCLKNIYLKMYLVIIIFNHLSPIFNLLEKNDKEIIQLGPTNK